MKIIKLRFKNLNSLYGEWSIDFTGPDYADQGLFAITGPTGSGKSTLLDAICLALYGATPRLGRITKSSNEVMSRQTGECFAEVTFVSQAGTYICHWHQHRAYRRPEGALAEAVHEIADATSGQVMETRKRDVLLTIEEKTGMDFARFTRSILLAQGGFSAFLQASADERSPILEQITGTGIYSDISIAVHERQKLEREQLNHIRAEQAAIHCLDEATVTALQQEAQQLADQDKQFNQQLESLQQALSWHEKIREMQQEQATLTQQAESISQQLEAFLPQRQRLHQAQRVLEIEGVYASLSAIRQQQADDAAALKKLSACLPLLEKKLASKRERHDATVKKLAAARQALQQERPLLLQVRELDLKLHAAAELNSSLRRDLKKRQQQIDQDEKEKKQLTAKHETLQNRRNQINSYLKQHAADDQLTGQLTVLRSQVERWQQLDALVAAQNLQLKKKQQQLQKATQQKKATGQAVNDLAQRHSFMQTEIGRSNERLSRLLAGRLLREYRQERIVRQDTLLMLRRIADLEDERKRLQDGRPCPLCGATDHPYASGQVPAPNETEQAIRDLDHLIGQAEQLEENIKEQEKKAQICQMDLTQSEQASLQADHAQALISADINRLAEEQIETRRLLNLVRTALAEAVDAFGEPLPEQATAGAVLLEQLAKRLGQWQRMQQQAGELERALQTGETELGRLSAVLQTRQEQLAELEQQQEDQASQLTALHSQRQTLYGDRKADQEEEKLSRQMELAEQAQSEAGADLEKIKTELARSQARGAALTEAIDQRRPKLDQAQAAFERVCVQLSFADEQSFLTARMTEDERRALAGQATQLDQTSANLKDRLAVVQDKLRVEQTRAITAETKTTLQEQRLVMTAQRKVVGEKAGAIKQQLNHHEAAREQAERIQEQQEAQQQVCRRWERLQALIGSADGKKFRNFAQGLTFECMVAQANRQLQQMSDRYLLVRDTDRPLELNVMDNDQAGEIRSTKNLSGGESFIVSLALALGLSRMASRHVRVDSLFLDEGFGTLDEEALETALDTLAGLQQEGKLIGVISHVSALKERIRTQLTVQPLSGGRSHVSGPGVRQI